MLERFVNYLGDLVKFKKSVEGQRRLMTPKLRKYIIERDYSTCQQCSNSTAKEPNLLLEVDHKVPVSKGSITTEDNLQTYVGNAIATKVQKQHPIKSNVFYRFNNLNHVQFLYI